MNCYRFLVEHEGQRFVVSDIYHDTAELAFKALLETLPGAHLIEVCHP